MERKSTEREFCRGVAKKLEKFNQHGIIRIRSKKGFQKLHCGLATKTWQMESTKENLEANKNGYGEGTFDFPLCRAEDCSDQW